VSRAAFRREMKGPRSRARRAAATLPIAGALLIAAALGVTVTLPIAEARAAADEKAAQKTRPRLDAEGIYAMTMTRGETGLHIVEYWSKGATLRAHTTISGHPFVTLVFGDTYYTLDPVFKRGVAIPRSERAKAADRGRRRLFGNEYEDMLAAGAERIRSEESPGGTLDVYRLTDDMGRRTVWVTADDYRLPLKFETFDRRTGAEARLEYLSWSPLRLNDAFFAAPGDDWEIDRVESYDAYLKAPGTASFKAAPVIFPLLLHGRP